MLKPLEDKLGYSFINKSLLKLALTLPSCESGRMRQHNQRLEFFGDAIIGMLVAETLFVRYPHAQEGVLTDMRLHLVSGHNLATLGRKLDLPHWITAERTHFQGDQLRNKPITDVVEALFGAAWVDGGLEAVRMLLKHFFTEEDWTAVQTCTGVSDNSKGQLLEWAQQHNLIINYTLTNQGGSMHDPTFTYEITVGSYCETGCGSSKKAAQTSAAKNILTTILNSF